MKVIVEGHLIETTEIWDVVYSSDSRAVSVKIRLIDKADIVIEKNIPYETTAYRMSDYKAPYEKLYNQIKEKWESDKGDIPVFKL